MGWDKYKVWIYIWKIQSATDSEVAGTLDTYACQELGDEAFENAAVY